MAKHLQDELNALKKKILALSHTVELSVQKSIKALGTRDEALAKAVIEADQSVDNDEVIVEEDCLKILATQQPVASDLRCLVAILKINNDLERIGDLAVNIAERVKYLAKLPQVEIPFDFNAMAKKTGAMLHEALDAFMRMDPQAARHVVLADDAVDAINREMYNRVFDGIRKSPENAECLIHYLTVSRHLERIADYATNIAEDVIYMIEGRIVRHYGSQNGVPKGAK